MMSITNLPIEVVSYIVESLELEDCFNLSLSCRHFQYIIRDDSICRLSLLANSKFSNEFKTAQETGEYSRALRSIIKRKEAVRSGRPFSVAVIAMAQDYIYQNDTLVYRIGQDTLRILCLRGTVTEEWSVNTRQLINTKIQDADESSKAQRPWPYKLTPLSYANGTVSCLLQHPQSGNFQSWLLFWDIHQPEKEVQCRPIDTITKIFVRNDAKYLYFGVRKRFDLEYDLRWVLEGFNIEKEVWIREPVFLEPFIGEDIGQTTSFEIFDGYFYGVSNDQAFEPERNEWNSFFYAFRFLPGDHCKLEVLPKRRSWRRSPGEGPVDDRWYTLQLVRDEQSLDIYVYETRKEWSPSDSHSSRNCYRKVIDFQTPLDRDPEPAGWDSEKYEEYRDPTNVHRGDRGSNSITFNYHQSPIRTYNAAAGCFVDLVRDASDDISQTPLRLRVRAKAKTKTCGGDTSQEEPPLNPLWHVTRADVDRDDPSISLWPPEPPRQTDGKGHAQTTGTPQRELYNLLARKTPEGTGLQWQADDRLIIYASVSAQDRSKQHPLVLVSFDPALRLLGLRNLLGGSSDSFDIHNDNPNGDSQSAVAPTISPQTHDVAQQPNLRPWFTTSKPYYLMDAEPLGLDLSISY